MRVLSIGVAPFAGKYADWKAKVECNLMDQKTGEHLGCGAELEVTNKDLRTRKWTQNCGYKGMRHYYVYVICPPCGNHIPLQEEKVHPLKLVKMSRQAGFDGYDLPDSWDPRVDSDTW